MPTDHRRDVTPIETDTNPAALTPKQREVITAASAGMLRIRVFECEVEGVPRTLVLMGETHLQLAGTARLAHSVLAEFRVRGYEG